MSPLLKKWLLAFLWNWHWLAWYMALHLHWGHRGIGIYVSLSCKRLMPPFYCVLCYFPIDDGTFLRNGSQKDDRKKSWRYKTIIETCRLN